MTERQSAGRVAAFAGLEREALRAEGERLREEALERLPELLDELQQNLERNGARVHRARTGAEAAEYVAGVVARAGGPVVKGKSMLADEIGLNHRLEADGVEVVETDLGQFVVQLAGETAEHLLAPAVHKSRADVRELLAPLAGGTLSDDPVELAGFARAHLREKFFAAHVGITGANFGVASPGAIALVTNEGNGRMCSSLPPVHVVLMGVERVVSRLEDLATLVPLLARSATGQPMTSYVTLIGGPRRGAEEDGPEEMHVVLVDNGRLALRETRYRPVLRCIRCGACQNVCPVFRQIGSRAYGWVYGGPIGAVLTPLLRREAGDEELGHASTLCAACDDVCPVRIPLHDLLLDLRRERAAGPAGRAERLLFRAWSAAWSRPALYRLSRRLAPALVHLPGPARRFARGRRLTVLR